MFGVDLIGRVRLAILGQGLNQRPVPLRQNRIFPKGRFYSHRNDRRERR
jgi:hypothetical protein